MISLRLSAEEYQALHTIYANYGARNISDFARLAMQRAIGHPLAADRALAARVHELDERLCALEEKVALLLAHEKEMA
jgi:hypothetical protein